MLPCSYFAVIQLFTVLSAPITLGEKKISLGDYNELLKTSQYHFLVLISLLSRAVGFYNIDNPNSLRKCLPTGFCKSILPRLSSYFSDPDSDCPPVSYIFSVGSVLWLFSSLFHLGKQCFI